MKITLILHPIGEKRPAGLGRSVHQFALSLLKERPQDEYVVISKQPVNMAELFPNITASITNVSTGGKSLWKFNIQPYCKSSDVVISFTPLLPLWFKHPAIIVFAHDFAYLQFGTIFHRLSLWFLQQWSFYRAAAICSVSKETKNVLKQFFILKKRTTLKVIYNGFDHYQIPHISSSVSHVNYDTYFLSVGVLKERKNTLAIVKAFIQFYALYPSYKLLLVGNSDTPYGLIIKEYVKSYARNNQIIFLGHVTDVELANLYIGATAVVYPSLVEGFGFPILEAFAHGTPVITSQGGALEEVAGGGALLVNPVNIAEIAEAMKQIIEPALAAELIKAGKVKLAQFTWNSAGTSLSTVIQEVVKVNTSV